MAAMVAAARGSAGVRSTFSASLLLMLSGLSIAAVIGAIVGSVGWILGEELRQILALLAAVAITLASLRQPIPFQLNRETNPLWGMLGDNRTVVFNGLMLGTGFATRLGYWLWYVVPIGVLAVGDPVLGALLWATYAGTRLGLSVSLFAWGESDRRAFTLAHRLAVPLQRTANYYHGITLGALIVLLASNLT